MRRQEVSEARQKSRVQWANEGDCNSKYFHLVFKVRNRLNNISSISVGGSKLETIKEVKKGIASFFEKHFAKENGPFLKPLSGGFQRLSADSIFLLEQPFTTDEVRATVWSCCGEKAPGPDGFNFHFSSVSGGL